MLSDYRFIPGTTIRDGVELLTAMQINPRQRMVMTTAKPKEARKKLPKALWLLPVLCNPCKVEQVLRLLRKPVLTL